jgi:antitoxin (DNA-binding transcriptional repressor) of toxin-antitoxin stability system
VKTATVRDLRNSFARVSRWLESGETVEITKHGKVFARILPATPPKDRAPKPDILARLESDFGNVVISDDVFSDVFTQAGNGRLS